MTDQAPNRSASGFDLTPPSSTQLAILEHDLNDEVRRVLLNHGT